MLKAWLAHPLTKGLDIDDPRTTHLRLQIIQEKSFLRQIYQEWYQSLALVLPPGEGAVLELGAGAGFMKDFIPELITSEVFYCPNIRAVLDASRLAVCCQIVARHCDDRCAPSYPATAILFYRGGALCARRWSRSDDRAMGHIVVKVCLHPVTSRAVSSRNPIMGVAN